MKEWLIKFAANHGERIVFMAIATCFGIGLYLMGLAGEGKTILIAVATLALNKARGTLKNGS